MGYRRSFIENLSFRVHLIPKLIAFDFLWRSLSVRQSSVRTDSAGSNSILHGSAGPWDSWLAAAATAPFSLPDGPAAGALAAGAPQVTTPRRTTRSSALAGNFIPTSVFSRISAKLFNPS